jgi:hypothetical protein
MASHRFFLIVFDPSAEKVLRLSEFTDTAEAAAARRTTEREFHGAATQVVVFVARSLDSVKKTHPHYFGRSVSGDALELATLK